MYQHLNEILDITKSFGRLRIYTHENKFIVRPSGIINPSLIKIDLLMAKEFGDKSSGWNYIVDTSEVIIANPINLIFLRSVKSLPNLSLYIIFAPSFISRFLIGVGKFIITPDQIITSSSNFKKLIL